MTKRKWLLYCPVEGSRCLGDFWGANRLYDIAVNDWTDSGTKWENVEYAFAAPGHKWPGVQRNLSQISQQYDYYAFFDNDIEISTDEVNRLFHVGSALGLDLFQAALSAPSSASYKHLKQIPGSLVRMTSFVEIMMPVFSRWALERCLPSFDESESGYGLDVLWANLLGGKNMAVVDAVVASHTRPIQSAEWRLSNGLSPVEEMKMLIAKHNLKWKRLPASYEPRLENDSLDE